MTMKTLIPPLDSGDTLLRSSDLVAMGIGSLSWLARQRREGNGPPFLRIGPAGRIVRYRLSDLRKYLSEVTSA